MAGSNTSDAIVVGEDWISEHYFATDGKQSFQAKVLERRKVWDEAAKADTATVRSRFAVARSVLLSTFSTFGEEGGRYASLPGLYQQLREILGYTSVALQSKRVGPVEWIHATGLEATAPLAVIEAIAVKDVEALMAKGDPLKPSKRDRTLLEPYEVDEKTQIHSVVRLLSHLFVQDDAPDFVLVLAGAWMLVAEKERWAEGRYLAVNLQVVAERADDKRGGETDRTLTCLEAKSLAPDPEGNLWWPGVLDESVKHTVGVSKDLREGVRLSIEIIANEVVRRRADQGLDPLPQTQAQDLARHSLRYLYRILFLLFAEASPELGVLPVGDPAYERGYSLDRLRELTLVEIAGPRAEDGTHLYQSLATLFHLVDQGHDGAAGATRQEIVDGNVERVDDGEDGLTFNPLKADLFLAKATKLIDDVGLGNRALQRVLSHLLLSKESKGKDRGFISYAELGINQLGAVYEGLMSYTGFFAEEDLHEVAKGGDNEKGSWVVPTTRSQSIAPGDFVKYPDPHTGERKPVVHEKGTFVFRLAGRERQQSASYYTPEVLTRFTVGQALVELIGPDSADETSVEWAGREIPRRMTAPEILDLTVCEPALGSGAFAIEAVQQLAVAYLKRRQEELGVKIDPDDFQHELQKVKAYIALHNVYGVDLNATAVELAEISLWLDTMGEGLQAPWFGLHLRRGNSLIGARRAVFRRDQLAKKAWIKEIPADKPLLDPATGESAPAGGGIHHFLLPAAGWGSSLALNEAKEIANVYPERRDRLNTWRKDITSQFSKRQAEEVTALAVRVETLWRFAESRLRIAESYARRPINVWGADDLPEDGAVSREQIEMYLHDPESSYQRLRSVMDAWCALWFWPLSEAHVAPPTIDQWLDACRRILGTHHEARTSGVGRNWRGGDQTLIEAHDWDSLDEAERLELRFAGAEPPQVAAAEHPWLEICRNVASAQGFFHWELDFAGVFGSRGGFDLQVGNPPWVRPRTDQAGLLAEGDPWWQLVSKAPQAEIKERRSATLALPGIADLVVDGIADNGASLAFLGHRINFPSLDGLQPDLYRCFMEQTWRHASSAGSVGLIHPESHFTDERAGILRAKTYRRLRRHWQFVNELVLFEIDHHVGYGVHVYGTQREPRFLQATSLYHPDTVVRSLEHDGSGAEPGLKDPDGNWDLRPHAARVIVVDTAMLRSWLQVLERDGATPERTRMVYTVNRAATDVIGRLAETRRVATLGPRFSEGWHESRDRRDGFFEQEWGVPESWDQVILQGPHLHVATPTYKTPNRTMLHNLDWSPVDLEALAPNSVPVTSYKPRGERRVYDSSYTHWRLDDGETLVPARNYYRLAWRNMAANTGERTLIAAIVPPGTAHIHGVSSVGMPGRDRDLVTLAAFSSSILLDFAVRSAPKSTISAATLDRLPIVQDPDLVAAIALRALRLNCLTNAYSSLWEKCYEDAFSFDRWAGGIEYAERPLLGIQDAMWTPSVPLRRSTDRRQALVELDALVALSLGVSADELCTVYRTQFAVLLGYDRERYVYDAAGRQVPSAIVAKWRRHGSATSPDDLVMSHPGSEREYEYVMPFVQLNREDDLRAAYTSLADRFNR